MFKKNEVEAAVELLLQAHIMRAVQMMDENRAEILKVLQEEKVIPPITDTNEG